MPQTYVWLSQSLLNFSTLLLLFLLYIRIQSCPPYLLLVPNGSLTVKTLPVLASSWIHGIKNCFSENVGLMRQYVPTSLSLFPESTTFTKGI